MAKAGSARKLSQKMKPQCHPAGAPTLSKTLSPQISKRVMKPLQEEKKCFYKFLLEFMRIFGVGQVVQGRGQVLDPINYPAMTQG